jgi:hypothetical protein
MAIERAWPSNLQIDRVFGLELFPNNTIIIIRIDKSFESMDNCTRININLKTNLRAMKNTNDSTTFSSRVVGMVQRKDNKRASYNHKNLYIPSNVGSPHHVPQTTKGIAMNINENPTSPRP